MQTALRELQEETGLTAILEPNASVMIEYPLSPVVRKQVVLFLGKVTGIPQVQYGEIEKYRWVSKEMLQQYLHTDTYNACKQLL